MHMYGGQRKRKMFHGNQTRKKCHIGKTRLNGWHLQKHFLK